MARTVMQKIISSVSTNYMECRVTTRNDNPTINTSRIIAAIAAIVLVVNFMGMYCLKPYICISYMSGNKL
jgi:hypothetical protein